MLPRLLLLWLVCDACQTSTSAHVVFKWLHIPLISRHLAVIHHNTDWWAWPWILLLCVTCGSENDTNGCHLAFQSYSSAGGISYISNKISKMASNLAKYPLNSWWIEGLYINSYRIVASFMQPFFSFPSYIISNN